ncbi:MAG: ABC transporter permease [Bacteroidota bacterium]|nr:ABC transporter permease [Bacteroidota bacterium]
MFKHYLKTSFRYLREHKIFSAINLIGLATAMCVVYFALLYVNFELSYDKFNSNADRIYRISTDVKTAAGINYETTSGPMAEALQTSFPEVKTATRIFLDYYIVQKDENNFGEETLAYADSSIFSAFSFPLIKGNLATVFNAPFTMVLSETAAKKYFGTTDCLGKTLTLDGKIPATVTGIMKDIPQNSHFRTNILLSMSSLIQPGTNWMTKWSRFGFSTYVLLNKNANTDELQKKLSSFANEHPLEGNLHYSLSMEPLTILYLHGKVRGNKAGATAVGSYTNIYIFSLVALFVLLIACFNFINLTTAFSLKRAKEIGVRKVMGASKKQLTFQFLADAVILSLLAFVIAVFLCSLLLPWFNELTGKTISTGIFEKIKYLGVFLLISIGIGILSGIYPAFFLSGFQPITKLKGKFANNPKGLFLRKSLVIAQFTISIVLIVATIIVYKQLNFMKNDNLGFKKEHNLVIDFHYDNRIIDHNEMVGSELTKISGIQYASISSAIPGRPNKKFPTTIEGINNEKQEFQSDAYFVDYNFIKQYGLKVIAGRDFSKNFGSDLRESMVINESAVKKLGFANPEDAIGKHYWQRGGTGLIIGVVKDFHFHSLHEEIQPLTMQVSPGFFTFLTLSISSDHIQNTIKNLEKKWAAIAPGLPMIYFFSDQTFNAQYKSEERFEKLFICFASLAILISCLGLLGLTSFNTIQRTKEIGIRKVLGASATSIVKLIAKEFIVLVIISFLIASPIAWIGMHYWLNNFPYRIPIGYSYFLMAGILALAVAVFTVSFQSIKAAIENPVKSLRTE